MKLTSKCKNWLIVGYIFALIIFSVVSFNGNHSLNKRQLVGVRSDYVIHAVFFLPWMILANLRWNDNNQCQVFWIVLCIGFALAAASEILQLLIPNKTFNYMDLIANGLGIWLGAMICLLLAVGGGRQKRV